MLYQERNYVCLSLGLTPPRQVHPRCNCLELRDLEALELSEIAKKPCRNLSRGQLQRVSLIRTLCLNAEIMLLDEPTTALDLDSDQKALALLKEWHSPEKVIVLVSHKPHITAWCTREVIVDRLQIRQVQQMEQDDLEEGQGVWQ